MKNLDKAVWAMLWGTAVLLVVTIIISLISIFVQTNDERLASFWLGINSNFIVSLIIIAAINIATIYYQQRKPSDDSLESRIYYLLNGTKVSDSARKFVRQKICDIASYLSEYNLHITYEGKDENLRAFKISIESNRTVRNMFKDWEYSENGLKYEVYTDSVGAKGTLQGQVTLAKVTQGSSVTNYVNSPIDVYEDGVVGALKVKIEPDSSAIISCRYWLWNKVNEKYMFTSQKYCSQINATIENRSGVTLKFRIPGLTSDLVLDDTELHSFSLPADEVDSNIELYHFLGE